MATLDADYLVIGAGAMGMAFTDALVGASDAEVVVVDRRHRPGGHWNDDYPFVRLHQPSALYGVASQRLGEDRIDESGPNAGYYERATAAEICDHYDRVLDRHLLPSGQVRFLGMHEHQGEQDGGHRVVSRLTGRATTVRVRRRVVDATYMEGTLPSAYTPPFQLDPDVRFATPNDLPGLAGPTSSFTVLGGGKTAMDTCSWLLDNGVEPDAICWIRSRDGWTNDRGDIQPMRLVGGFTRWIADQNQAAAEAEDLTDLARRLEAAGCIHRLDPDVEPSFYRGAILSAGEREALRSIEHVVRLGRVRAVTTSHIDLDEGSVPSSPDTVVVCCTAPGLGARRDRPVFDDDRITLQWVQTGIAPFSAALVGQVEATRDDTADKNRLCPANGFSPSADIANLARNWRTTQQAVAAWMGEPDLNAWLTTCRLAPLGNAAEHLAADPDAMASLVRMLEHQAPAIDNLDRILAA